jgi:AraC family ethanolamine operon transcriptional activator
MPENGLPAEAIVRANLDMPIPISRLCRVVGVSERGLRNAFYEVHGMGPKRWIMAERLQGVQVALREPRGIAITVTEVATDHGFYQLGKFAAIYKRTFGEAPSTTLHSASVARPHSTVELHREHADAC